MTSLTRTDTARMPSGMTGGSPAPASFDASLAGRIGSFLTMGTMRPRPTISSGLTNAPSGAWPSGNLSDLQVLVLQLGAELQVGVGHDDRLRLVVVDRRHWLVVHHVVGAVGQSAAGEDGDGEDGEDSVAHERPLAFVPHDGDRCIVSGAPVVDAGLTSRTAGSSKMKLNG